MNPLAWEQTQWTPIQEITMLFMRAGLTAKGLLTEELRLFVSEVNMISLLGEAEHRSEDYCTEYPVWIEAIV